MTEEKKTKKEVEVVTGTFNFTILKKDLLRLKKVTKGKLVTTYKNLFLEMLRNINIDDTKTG